MKRAIIFIIFILTLGALGALELLFALDYKQVEQELIGLIGSDATSTVTMDRIEVVKFPVPQLVVHNVKVPGILNADTMVVNFSLMSVLKRKPLITTITVNQAGFDLKIDVQYEGDKMSYGKATIRTGHIGQFLKDYPDLQEVVLKFIPPHSTDLIFDIVASNEYLTFTNLTLNSAVLGCDGEVALSRNNVSSSKLKLTCNKVLMVDDGLENVVMSAEANESGIHLTSASGNIISGGKFAISGDVTKNLYRSLFSGALQFSHSDINKLLNKIGLAHLSTKEQAPTTIATNFKITPVEFLFHNLNGQMGQLQVKGDTDIKLIGITPRVSLKMNVNGFDSAQSYPVISPSIEYLSSLMKGSGERSYSTKFVPIRNINYLGSYEINLVSPKINDQAVDNLDITGNVLTGRVNVKSFNYAAGADHVSGSLAIDTISMKPIFHFTVTDGSLTTSNLTIQNLLNVNSSLQSSDLSKMKIIADLSLQSLVQGDKKFSNVKFSASNEDNAINITNCSAEMDKASIQANGAITISSPMSVNLGYVYNTVDLSQISRLFSSNLYLNGVANFGGVITTNGSSLEELLYKLYTKSKFIATNVDVHGIAMDELVTKLNSLKYDKAQLNEDLKLATTSGMTSIHTINGNCSIDAGVLFLKDITFSSNYTSSAFEALYNIYTQDFDLSSQWSFQLPTSDTCSSSTSLGISLKRTKNDTLRDMDTKDLMQLFDIRTNMNMIGSIQPNNSQ